MAASYQESEFVFCDLQAIYRYLRTEDESLARRFLEAAYDSFEFLAENPFTGRCRMEFGYEGLRSWRVQGFKKYLIFYRTSSSGIQIWRVLHGSRDLPTFLR